MRKFALVFAVLLLLAAACSGETSDEQTGDTSPPADPSDGSGDPAPVDGDFPSATFDDPRGDLFQAFQDGIDRNHPFNSLDQFCFEHPAAESREATDPGITEDSIEIHHIRQQLENLADIGFGVPVGEPAKMFDVFVEVINEQCGGIRGRTLDLGLSEFDPISATAEDARIATCIEATEDRNAVVVLNSTGFQGAALLCITEEHETALITTQGVSDEFQEAGAGRLLTVQEGLTESMTELAVIADDEGLLDDTTIGVIGADTPGQPESVDRLVAQLEDLGHDVAVEATLGCGGATSCTEGLEQAVTDMADAGVDAVFPMLNVVSLPGLVGEMAAQGFEAGEVQFFNSRQNSQDGLLVTSKVVAFGGDVAGDLYDDAFIITAGDEVPEESFPFDDMCRQTYAANGGTPVDQLEGSEGGMIANVCGMVRVMARAIYDAGDNPTRADIYSRLANIGGFDGVNMVPLEWTTGDTTAPNVVQTARFSFPCAEERLRFDDNNTCVIPNGDWQEAF